MYPPYFDIFSCQNNYEREIKQLESNNWIREIITAAAISNDKLFYLMKMYVASFVYRAYFLKRRLHQMCAVRCTVFRTTNIPSAPYVRIVCPWEATTDTMDITGIPPHTTLLAEIESFKCIIEDFKLSVTRDIKVFLKYGIDSRDICGPGFV